MAKRKSAMIEGTEFLVDEDVKLGEILPSETSSVIDQTTGKEMSRDEFANLPAAGSDIRANFTKLEKGQ